MENLTRAVQQVKLDSLEPSACSTLWDLPNELLIEILRCLDTRSLKQARLTCRRWREAGAHSLFGRVYFAPRKDIMEVFSCITNNPVYASNVTEMIYDARMFWGNMTEYRVYARAYNRGLPEEEPEDELTSDEEDSEIEDESIDAINLRYDHNEFDAKLIGLSLRKYRSLLHEQASILGSGHDYHVLCIGLARMTNLKRISVVDRFEDPMDFSPYVWDHFNWYHNWAARSFEDIAPPSRWLEAKYTRHGPGLSIYPWDFRGVENLFKATYLHAPKLGELLLGCQHSNLSSEIYSKTDVSQILAELAPRFVTLKVDCQIRREEPGLLSINAISKVLYEGKNLERLYIRLGNFRDVAGREWNSVFQGGKWQRLSILDLGDGDLGCATLKAIGDAHFEVLRELSLRNVFMEDRRSWEGAAAELGPHFKLDFISLIGVCDEISQEGVEDRPTFEERIRAAAFSFLQWIPIGDIGIVCRWGAVKAWHKHNRSPKYEGEFTRVN